MKPTLVHEGDKPLDREPDDVRAAFDRAMAMLFIMNGRLCETELQLRQLRGEPSKPLVETQWTTIKQASGLTGFSRSGIRRQIAAGKIAGKRLGGRWIIDRASLASKVR
jgi:Helix-turn-helix domain